MFYIYSGLSSGLVLGAGVGNVKITLIKNTLESGIKSGMVLLAGVALSDMVLITLVNISGRLFKIRENWQQIIFSGTGVVFIILGLFLFIKTLFWTNSEDDTRFKNLRNLNPFIIGFLINTLNPYNYLTWMGFLVFLNKLKAGFEDKLLFFFFALLGMMIIDGLIVLNIKKANWLLKYKKQLSILNALIFIGLGLKLLL